MYEKRKVAGAAVAIAIVATLLSAIGCASPTQSDSIAAIVDSKALVSTLIQSSSAKLSALIDDSQYLSLSQVLPAGTTTPGIMKIDGVPALNQKYGPFTATKYYFQDSSNATVVGFDFVSEMPIIAVYVKGGQVGTVTTTKPNGQTTTSTVSGGYLYTWSEGSAMGGTELTTAYLDNDPAKKKTGISHVEFAWIPRVLVALDAATSYDRQYDWSIAKSNDASSVTPNSQATPFMLDPGQSAPVSYTVTVSPTAVDYDFLVKGSITVSNPDYNPGEAVLTSVSAGDATVTGSLAAIPAGSSASFSYSFAPSGKASGAITATVATSSNVAGGSGEASYSFGDPAHLTDLSIALTDSLVPSANRSISLGGAYSFSYTYSASATSLVPTGIVNTASFVESDSGRTGSASSELWVQLKPASGYTRSPGYWKTHAKSAYQNHPVYDSTWDRLGVGSAFFLGGQSNIDVMWNSPAGNAYYNLAFQYVAAKLNVLTGYAPPADVAAALSRASYYFGLYTPAQVGAWKSNDAKRQELIRLAGTLGAFNIDR